MKVVIIGATGSIGGIILEYVLRRSDVTSVIALTRKPLTTKTTAKKIENIIINDFGKLGNVPDETWEKIVNADALVWAMGTYNLNEDVNLRYPLAFQDYFAKKAFSSRESLQERKEKFKFILLSGAFVEPNQSRRLWFLWDQRKMKGVLQTKTVEFAEARRDYWEALVIRPGGVLFGGSTFLNKLVELIFGRGFAIRGEELGAFVADLVVNGSGQPIIENRVMVERGRELLQKAA